MKIYLFMRWHGRKHFKLEYRCDPIPYTGKKTPYRFYRRFLSFTERKWNCAHQELEHEFGINNLVRKKRSYKNIPDPWDDIPRTDFKEKSWKRYRKHQWK